MFAYGATGAGKTFSMLGSPQTPGVIFLSMMDLYNIKESERDERHIGVSVSYLEVCTPLSGSYYWWMIYSHQKVPALQVTTWCG